MYEAFFGLREPPFELTANPRYLLLTPRHREALSILEYAVAGRKGLTLLTGEAGTGKTTLVRAAIAAQATAGERCTICVSNPALTRTEFYELLAAYMGFDAAVGASKSRFLFELDRSVSARDAAGGVTALIIDEAQSLPDELLEELRLLANLETPDRKLLPVVLVGQPELAERLDQPSLRQLRQRIALRCALVPLTLEETGAYVAARIRTAGGQPMQTFTRDAVRVIHEASGGVPRTINIICDNALVTGFALGRRPVDRPLVLEVCRDFDLLRDDVAKIASPSAVEPVRSVPSTPIAAVADNAGRAELASRGETDGQMFSTASRRRFGFRSWRRA